MIQFQENARTGGKAEGRKTDRPYFIGPFQLQPGVKNWQLFLWREYC